MNTNTRSPHTPASRPRFTRSRLLISALGAVILGSAGWLGAVQYHAARPRVIVTSTSGAATINFRVTGMPVPGKIEGVTPKSHLFAAKSGGHARRDEHARTFLGVARHPVAVFSLGKLNTADQFAPGARR